MNLFYEPELNETKDISVINTEESNHIIKVLRHKPGDKLYFTDGRGGKYLTEIISASGKNCTVKIVEHTKTEANSPKIHIAIAPPKKIDRFEFFVEKAVEAGISEITPIITRFSERKKLNIQRIEKIAISAMKQSLRYYKPQINQLINFNDFISKQYNAEKYIALCNAEKKINQIPISDNYLIIIGPEGGFDNNEINLADEKNFKSVKLSNSRLRTETAALFSVFALNFIHL